MIPKHRNRRLSLIAAGAVLLSGAGWLVASALERNISYFYTPAEAAAANLAPTTRIRLGGMVEEGSLIEGSGLDIRFRVTDGAETVAVYYSGPRPDLFREGQGVIAQGRFDGNGDFAADTILAKHDENYVPRELIDIMEAAKAGS
jgi:cytochrome c-type biogenesis protein CcmE